MKGEREEWAEGGTGEEWRGVEGESTDKQLHCAAVDGICLIL